MRRRGMKTSLIVLAFLTAGALVSIAVAWGVEIARAVRASQVSRAGASPSQPSTQWRVPDPGLPGEDMMAIRVRRFGREEWIVDRSSDGPVDWGAHTTPVPPGTLPWWVIAPEAGVGRGTASVGFGFPLVCMKLDSDRQTQTVAPMSYNTRMTYRASAWRWWYPDRQLYILLPLKPVWIGLVVDSVLWAGLLGSPWWVRELVRSRRRKRGLCAWCGYDLKGGDGKCPECGREQPRTPIS